MQSRRSFLAALSLVGLASLPFGPFAGSGEADAQPQTSPFPLRLLSTGGDGPALFLGPELGAPAIGYLSPDVEIELAEAPSQHRVLVRIRGAMRVRAYLDATRMAARIQRRGRLRGTSAYLAGGDYVHVLGFEADGRARITARIDAGTRIVEQTGTFPIVGLGATAPAPGPETLAPGTRSRLRASMPLVVRDLDTGSELVTLPAGLIPARTIGRVANGWSVLIGNGPYLAGVVGLEPLDAEIADLGPSATGYHTGHVLPGRLAVDQQLQLVRLAQGTRVSFDAQTIAVLDEPGMARIVQRYDATGEADAYVAVDDRVAVRGMIPLAAIIAESPTP